MAGASDTRKHPRSRRLCRILLIALVCVDVAIHETPWPAMGAGGAPGDVRLAVGSGTAVPGPAPAMPDRRAAPRGLLPRLGAASGAGAVIHAVSEPEIVEALDIASVWSGHPVGFHLLTHGDRQLAAFYDDRRRLTIAARRLGQTRWDFARLPTSLGWDSHNSVTVAIDLDGHIHVSGNMHRAPLVYFRTSIPLDIQSFQRIPAMVGRDEQRCTYPEFFRGPSGDLVFTYRDGTSGNGNHILDIYDRATRTWRRLLTTPLLDGQGRRNAYPVGPVAGPDGWWHLVWVWRERPDAAANHDLSYARTRDLSHWETGAGKPLELPITLATGDVIDAVPVNGGMINNNTKVGFDSRRRPVIAYHKFDENGNTQLYNARLENGAWRVYRTSDWRYRWDFSGGGTLVSEIQVEPVRVEADGTLTQTFSHVRYGTAAFRLDEVTLRPLATIEAPRAQPRDLERVESATPGMRVRWATDTGAGPDRTVQYMLRWETLDANRDQPRASIPPPTTLRLYGFRVPAARSGAPTSRRLSRSDARRNPGAPSVTAAGDDQPLRARRTGVRRATPRPKL